MRIGETIQIVSLELGTGCNLVHLHPQCPAALGLSRYDALPRPMRLTADMAVDTVRELHDDFGFRGWVNLSHYNEPLMTPHVTLRAASLLAQTLPDLPRMLITNGTRFPEDVTPLGVFTRVYVTDYGGHLSPDPSVLEALRAVTEVVVTTGKLDDRMGEPGPDRSDRACVYPFRDLTIDAFGNVRLCCFDWQGLASPGNIFLDTLSTILAQWVTTVRCLSGVRMTDDAPAVCRTCRRVRFQTLSRAYPPARAAAKAWLQEASCGSR